MNHSDPRTQRVHSLEYVRKEIEKDPTYREFLKTIGWKKQEKKKK